MKKRYQADTLPRRPLEEARLKISRLSPKKLGLPATLREVCRLAAEAIAVERVGIWLFVDEQSAIRCACLYEQLKQRYSEGTVLRVADFPGYFEHLGIRKTIPADHAEMDPRTDELAKAYLQPLGITSLLDAVILQNDRIVGVVCHEHTGAHREWTTEERDFAGSVADFLAFKLQSAKLAELQQQLHRTTSDLASYQQRLNLAHMAAGVAHDFRNLLTVIKGYTTLLAQDSGSDAGVQRMCGQIAQAAEKGEALTADLMALSGNQTGHPTAIDVPPLVRQLLPLLQQTAGPRHPVETRLAADTGRVFIDPLQLERILLNLVANARDAMPGGGPITLTVAGGSGDSGTQPGASVVLTVTDTGTGIDPAILGQIFEPFFTTKARHQGTGLGLAIVRSGMELAGGRIQVESTPGTGTTFRLTLPCIAAGA
jgi:two-component system, cell cycle sensor histidine kinase and response regulator CckA